MAKRTPRIGQIPGKTLPPNTNYMKLFLPSILFQLGCITLSVNGYSSMTGYEVTAVSQTIIKALRLPGTPSLAHSRGPVDSDYHLLIAMKELCRDHLNQSDAMAIKAQVLNQHYESDSQSRAIEVTKAISTMALEPNSGAETAKLLSSQIPGVRVIGCCILKRSGGTQSLRELKTVADSDPYILVGLDSKNAIVFSSPLRIVATEALAELGRHPPAPVVTDSEGFAMLDHLLNRYPTIEPEIETLLASALSSTYHGVGFLHRLNEFMLARSRSSDTQTTEFVKVCRKVIDSLQEKRGAPPSPWPTDELGNPLPAPPTRP